MIKLKKTDSDNGWQHYQTDVVSVQTVKINGIVCIIHHGNVNPTTGKTKAELFLTANEK